MGAARTIDELEKEQQGHQGKENATVMVKRPAHPTLLDTLSTLTTTDTKGTSREGGTKAVNKTELQR